MIFSLYELEIIVVDSVLHYWTYDAEGNATFCNNSGLRAIETTKFWQVGCSAKSRTSFFIGDAAIVWHSDPGTSPLSLDQTHTKSLINPECIMPPCTERRFSGFSLGYGVVLLLSVLTHPKRILGHFIGFLVA